MKNRIHLKLMSAFVALGLLTSPFQAYAEPAVIEDSNLEISNPEQIDDSDAVKNAQADQKNRKLADPQKAADYLIDNFQTNVVSQVTTNDRDTSLPEKYDLRDKGVVTPVKMQSPWGTCWGFAAIAACETSILSDMGKTYEETGLDLSEHHLTYFSRTALEDSSSQDGEGIHMFDNSTSLNTGGFSFTACNVFASGIGPVEESLIPYRGTNSKTDSYLFFNVGYAEKDDWTIPEDYEFIHDYELKESNILPSPAVYEFEEGANTDDPDVREASYKGYDASATDIIKKELMEGRAVSIAYSADVYQPEQLESDGSPVYLNTEDNKWCHYTFDGGSVNHAVTIVGWDDSIKSTDFLDHSDDKYGDGLAHQPEGDGAWIVKNSWGAETESFPNSNVWGITNEDGESTGYFYISYYDRSLYCPETFQFDVTKNDNNDTTDEYDYLQSDVAQGWADSNGLQMANVFTAKDDGTIDAVSCQTNSVNVSVTYQIYLLDDDAVTPDDGKLAATATADYAYAGYHKTKLDNPVTASKGQKYSIIVTSCFTDGTDVYYEFSATTGDSKEAVEEYNRKVLYRHRGDAIEEGMTEEEAYADELIPYYSEGVVNEGESFVYMNKLGQWADFGQVVPCLQKTDAFTDNVFDNFPIKAYVNYKNTEVADADSEELNYAEPAGPICFSWFIKILVILAVIGVVLTVIVFAIIHIVSKKNKKKKEMQDKLKILELENAQLKHELEDFTKKTSEEETEE